MSKVITQGDGLGLKSGPKPNGALLLSELMNPAMDRRSGIPQKSQPEIVMMAVAAWISRTKQVKLKTRKRGIA